MDADQEAVAEALWHHAEGGTTVDSWSVLVEDHPDDAEKYRDLARVAIEALAARPDDAAQ